MQKLQSQQKNLIRKQHFYWIGVVATILSLCLGASRNIFINLLSRQYDPFQLVFWSMAMTLLLFSILNVRKFPTLFRKLKDSWGLVLWANLAAAVCWIGTFVSLKYWEPSLAALTAIGIVPVLTIFLGPLLRPGSVTLKEEFISGWGLIAVIAAAFALRWSEAQGLPLHENAFWFGAAGVLASGTGVFANNIFGKKLHDKGFTESEVLTLRFWLAALVTAVYVVSQTGMAALIPQSPIEVGVFVVGCMIVPIFLGQIGIRRLEPITFALIFSLNPLVTFMAQIASPEHASNLSSLLIVIAGIVFIFMSILARNRTFVMANARRNRTKPELRLVNDEVK